VWDVPPSSGWHVANLGGSKGEDIIFFGNYTDIVFSDLARTLQYDPASENANPRVVLLKVRPR
jgi:hypothetical protein